MAIPNHPNDFALRQEVLFRLSEDTRWREGTIQAVTVDDRKNSELHVDGCDGNLYIIADHAFDTMMREERKKRLVTECQCDVMIVDADATGRWFGQRLEGPRVLELLLVDAIRRGKHVETSPSMSGAGGAASQDRVQFLEVPGHHHLASADIDDLVFWASGVPTSRWKEPVE